VILDRGNYDFDSLRASELRSHNWRMFLTHSIICEKHDGGWSSHSGRAASVEYQNDAQYGIDYKEIISDLWVDK
jgi:hypothetical protein